MKIYCHTCEAFPEQRRGDRENSKLVPSEVEGLSIYAPGIVNPKGFTLIELLVVIAVMTLLMALLLPVLGRVRRQGRALACRSNLRQWGLSLHSYGAANDGRTPPFWPGSSNEWVPNYWHALLCNSTDPNEILLCPTARRAPQEGWEGGTFRAWRSKWSANGSFVICSYGGNASVGYDVTRPERPPHPRLWEAVDVKAPDRVPFFFDCASPFFVAVAGTPGLRHDMGPPPQREGYQGSILGDRAYQVCMNRHEGAINTVFLDGSVRKVGLKELWTLKWHRQYNTANRWTKARGVQAEDWPEWMRGFKDY